MEQLISRQAAIDAIDVLCQEHRYKIPGKAETYSQYNEAWQDALDRAEGAIGNLPPAEPQIIYCKDCRKHNKRIGDYVEKSDGTYDWIWKDQACPLAEFRGKAQGHEFDYQFCAYGENRMSIREEQCNKVCRVLDDVLANRPTERDSLIVAVRKAFAEPKRGKWIHHPEIGWGETWLCDQCGEKTTSTVMGKPRDNYCPNCGARMEGDDE